MGFFIGLGDVFAQDLSAPIPSSRQNILEDLNEDIEQQKQQASKAKQETNREEQLIKKLRSQMISVTKDIQLSNKKLQLLKVLEDELEIKNKALLAQIKQQQYSLSNMILASQRLKRVPPENVLLKPNAPLKTAQTTLILKTTLQAIKQKANALKMLLLEYQATRETLAQKRRDTLNMKKALQSNYNELENLSKQRNQKFTRQKILLSNHTKKLNRLAKKAKNIKELIKNIQVHTPYESLNDTENKILLPPAKLPNHGSAQLPLSGLIKTKYGEEGRFGVTSKGLVLESYDGALVVAPMNGQVKFAGPFKNYGTLIIIEHRSGYHSLIGGLEKIDVNVGQVIVSGEPIGILGGNIDSSNSSNKRGELYFELRHDGAPIDPSRKFSDLG